MLLPTVVVEKLCVRSPLVSLLAVRPAWVKTTTVLKDLVLRTCASVLSPRSLSIT